MIEKKVLVKGIEVHYKVFGGQPNLPAGRQVLILHGWGSNSGRWQKVAELLAEKNIQSIIPDLPGFGQSQEPSTSWGLDDYVNWLLDFTSKVPSLNRDFYLAGHSFGGAVAVKFSIKYNQRVQKLFLIASACVRKQTIVRKLWYSAAKTIKIVSFLPGYNLFRKAAYRFVLRKSDYPYVSGIMKETYLRVISEDLSYRVNFLKVPTVIIWGDKDEATSISQAQFIHRQIPNSKLIIIPGADHSLHVKLPELLAEKILENLANVSYNEQLLSLKDIV